MLKKIAFFLLIGAIVPVFSNAQIINIEYGTIDSSSALWTRSENEISKDQYKDFYQQISHNVDEPWLTLHFKSEGNLRYTGLLFVSKKKSSVSEQNSIKLYINKVFVSEEIEQLVPKYLRFVQGVIDSADLPSNTTHEMLQKLPLMEQIKKDTTSRLLKELKEKSKDYDNYIEFWKNFGVVLKEGIYEDIKNREDIASMSYFYSTKDNERLTSLDEYISRCDKDQKDIYYITGNDINALRKDPQLKVFKQKGIEVLLMNESIDERWPLVLPNYKGYAVKHVSQFGVDIIGQHETKKDSEDGLMRLKDLMGKFMKNEAAATATQQKTEFDDIKDTENKAVEANAVSEGAVLPEGEALTEEETPPPPANVTVEERIEIETESKKNIRKTIKKQDTKEREISLGIMNWAEKEIKIRELMAGGMSYKDAKKNAEETVMLPKMNVKKDKDVEKYLYKKGAFIADEQ